MNLKWLSSRCTTGQQDYIKKMRARGSGIGQMLNVLGCIKGSIILKQCTVNKTSNTPKHCGQIHPQCSESNITFWLKKKKVSYLRLGSQSGFNSRCGNTRHINSLPEGWYKACLSYESDLCAKSVNHQNKH